MLDRCKHNLRYVRRGIEVCERWHKFENFLADVGVRPGLEWSIDRTDNEKGYFPGNCRWATKEEQANNRSSSVTVSIGGVEKTATVWARENGVPPDVALKRIRGGWNRIDAVTKPYELGESQKLSKPDTDVVLGRPFVDLTGQKFGRWTVIEPDGYRRSSIAWKCRCECGKTKTVGASELCRGNSKSCGCLRREVIRERSIKHTTAAVGDKFNHWTVKQLVDGESALCTCQCGAEKIVELSNLRLNKSKCCRKCSTKLRYQQMRPKTADSDTALPVVIRQPTQLRVTITPEAPTV